ncbi:MAG TPA: MogA/MoaB family molybdenum cofactor biosynthesis protein [Terriglobales bacterium]|nr:MogA/MoaB family molybdenum cofactor biosynthesis protein [Terriglobales bacterium]
MPSHRYRAAILTISDSRSAGTREDTASPALRTVLTGAGFVVAQAQLVPDEHDRIVDALVRLAAISDFLITTGGTGLSPRDVTPEATLEVCDREIPGIAELIRSEGLKMTPYSALSRGVCGSRNETLIVNLPGNPAGAEDSLRTILHLIPHALDLLRGQTEHSQGSPQ